MANGFLLRSYPFTATTPLSEAPGTSAAFVQNDYMGMVLRGIASGGLDIRIDLGVARAVDTVALLNVAALTGHTYYIEANTTNDFAAPPLSIGPLVFASEFTINAFRHMLAEFGSQTYRWWRISFGVASGYQHEGARVVIGTRVQPARNFEFGLARGARDLGEVEFSSQGALLRRRGRIQRTLGLSWGFVSKVEAEQQALPFLEGVGNTEFVLACIDPAVSAERSRRLYFGPLEGNLGTTWFANDLWQKRLQMVSII